MSLSNYFRRGHSTFNFKIYPMKNTNSIANSLVSDVLQKPCFGFICALNEADHPILARIFGFNFDPKKNTLTAYAFKKDFQAMQNNFTSGVKIAMALSSSLDYHTIQLKGTLNKFYNTPEEEMKYPRSCNGKQVDIMNGWGIPKDVFANWSFEQSISVMMDVNEIFDQTPWPNAGKKINY